MMKKVTVTYKAPHGDSKVLEAFGHTFFDGKEETITVDDDVLTRLQGNRMFKCGEPQDADEQEADPEKEKAADEQAAAADKAKREAQEASGPVIHRGATLQHPDDDEDEHADDPHAEHEQHEHGEATDEGRTFPRR